MTDMVIIGNDSLSGGMTVSGTVANVKSVLIDVGTYTGVLSPSYDVLIHSDHIAVGAVTSQNTVAIKSRYAFNQNVSGNILIDTTIVGNPPASGSNNVFIGRTISNGYGNDNVMIGGGPSPSGPFNGTFVCGTNAVPTVNNGVFFNPGIPVPNEGIPNVDVHIDLADGRFAPNASSRRYKGDIEYEEIADIDTMKALRPVEFDYTFEDNHSVGFIAEELVEVLPQLVPLDRHGLPATVQYQLIGLAMLPALRQQEATIAALEAAVGL
jgi:hypothetical protein